MIRAKGGLMLHRILGQLEGICYFVHFLLSLVFGRKDKLIKLILSLLVHRPVLISP